MAYGRGFQRGNYGNGGGQRRNGFSRSGGNRQGGTFEHKEGKGRAFGNDQRDERGPFAGGSFKGLDGQNYRISLFLNVPAAEFNNQDAQADASELASQIAEMIKGAGLTIGISVQEMDANNSGGNRRQSAPQQQREFTRPASQQYRRVPATPLDEQDEPPQEDDDQTNDPDQTNEAPWTADETPEPKPRTRRATKPVEPVKPATKSAGKPRARK